MHAAERGLVSQAEAAHAGSARRPMRRRRRPEDAAASSMPLMSSLIVALASSSASGSLLLSADRSAQWEARGMITDLTVSERSSRTLPADQGSNPPLENCTGKGGGAQAGKR